MCFAKVQISEQNTKGKGIFLFLIAKKSDLAINCEVTDSN